MEEFNQALDELLTALRELKKELEGVHNILISLNKDHE